MKMFPFGQLVPREDICNRQKEIKRLRQIVKSGGRGMVYGPRRFGKTSVVQNVVVGEFRKQYPKAFILYADLFQMDTTEEFCRRLQDSFGRALGAASFFQKVYKGVQGLLKGIELKLSHDPLTGSPVVTVGTQGRSSDKSLEAIMQAVSALAKNRPSLMVFDEFQDILAVKGLESRLRTWFQTLEGTSLLVLGSQHHILSEMFSSPRRPFYGFGSDVFFGPIERKEWIPYMNRRFATTGKTIQHSAVDRLCLLMHDVPNAIQELCQWIQVNYKGKTIRIKDVQTQLRHLLEEKRTRHIEVLGQLSKRERRLMREISRAQPIKSILSHRFLHKVEMSSSGVKSAVERLTGQGWLQQTEEGVSLVDPIFSAFLKTRSE